ncbi:hypothetical protein V7x_40690 [Crateriforma conspicua]|uniref:Uncharacterized protein n=1 Tax=Crateriforma conspicua TaxID=2527996 RepID=A0A5C6FJN4_9PLAN|nr:hypothetical protein [Crateriforma conspicua]TWU62340.1 hypothetical protein V7x_40690 [Crateriforma conspicua]
MKRLRQPENAIILTTYEQLASYVGAFARGYINLVILVGSHGLSKSRTVREALPDACWIEGNASPFGIYQALYRNRDRTIVMDDLDSLHKDHHGVRLLKALCNTESTKTVGWHTATRVLERANIPREFTTSSRVIIICNDWATVNRNVAALQDRGHLLSFQPTAAEVHAKAAEWFDDAEILEWFGENLDRVGEPSLRWYVKAQELKRSSLDWKQVIQLDPASLRRKLVVELIGDKSFATQEERAREFSRRGGGCRATFFNHVRRVR